MNTRQDERMPLMLYLDVLDAHGGERLGHLGDISPHGLMLITHHPLELGREYPIQIDIPDSVPVGRESLQMRIVPRWEKPNLNPAQICMGCQITDLTEKLQEEILMLSQYLGFDAGFYVSRVSL